MPPTPPAPEPTHFLGYKREAARCAVSPADMTDAERSALVGGNRRRSPPGFCPASGRSDGGQLNFRFSRATPRVERSKARPCETGC